MPNILDTVQISGSSYDLKDKNAPSVSAVTQQEYDNLPSSAKTSNTFFVITDAEAGDLTQYWTSAQTQSAINQSVSGKQDTLVSSVNIKTINNESILGSGNIDIQGGGGGGKAIEAGRGISITTGETADTVSFNLPIYNGSGNNSIYLNSKNPQIYPNNASGENSFVVGTNNIASGSHSIAMGGYDSYGDGCSATTYNSFAMGRGTLSEGFCSIAKGYKNKATNQYEESGGRFNVSSKASDTFGDSGNTLFSVGNGTSNSARHNAFEIRQNGDIYLSSGGTDIKLQDHLGGGSSYTAGDGIDITNDVISVTGKVNISDNNVSAFSDFKVALESGKDYTSDNISTFYLGVNKTNYVGTNDLVTITTTDTNYPTIIINCDYSNGNILRVRTTSGITSLVENGVAQITLTGGTLATVVSASNGGVVFLYKQYTSGQTADVVEDTVYDALKELSNNKLDYIYKDETINSKKTFLWGSTSDKPIIFKQTNNEAKLGFICKNSASTNNELATFEFRPDTYTDSSSVKHPLLYLGHYRNNNTANAGVPQTMVGFRQYDQKGAAAYHYLIPLPAEAKTPFSLTTSYKNYFAPLGFKNGSTMITADNTGVVDLSSELGGLKLVKLTQSEYDLLATKDDNTVYFIGDSTNGYTMKIGSANVN